MTNIATMLLSMLMKRIILVGALLFVFFLGFLFYTSTGRIVQFILGGALINIGYRFQDHLEDYLLEGEAGNAHEETSPDTVLNSVLKQNRLSSSVRGFFPRSDRHPMIAIVICMDSRIDTTEITGDTRKFYYIIRTAGSTLSEKEEDMIEFAVRNGVKAVILTTHSDCAAEKVAASESESKLFPALLKAMSERAMHIEHLKNRPLIASRLNNGTLKLEIMKVDTETGKLVKK